MTTLVQVTTTKNHLSDILKGSVFQVEKKTNTTIYQVQALTNKMIRS